MDLLQNEKEMKIKQCYKLEILKIHILSIKAQIQSHAKRNIIPDLCKHHIISALDQLELMIKNNYLQVLKNINHVDDTYDFIYSYLSRHLGEKADYIKIGAPREIQKLNCLKLWIIQSSKSLRLDIQKLQFKIIKIAEEHTKTAIPIYINNTNGPVVSLSYILMSYFDALERDKLKLSDINARYNASPFGVGGPAGSILDINRSNIARLLGFTEITTNALGTILDHDIVIDFLSFSSTLITHVIRIIDDMLLWSHPMIDFIYWKSNFANDNSVDNTITEYMQLGIAKSQSAFIYSALINAFITIKNVGINAINEHLNFQELVFKAHNSLISCIETTNRLISNFNINEINLKEAVQKCDIPEQDIVEWLLSETNLNYIQAMKVAEEIINQAWQKRKKPSRLTLQELQQIEPQINKDIFSILTHSRAIISRRSYGGTNPTQLKKIIKRSKKFCKIYDS